MSLTKRHLDRPVLDALVAELLDGARISRTTELTGGMFNAAYRLLLDDGRDVVLKASPPADAPLLTHEHGLMRTETAVYRRLAGVAGVPVPDVVAARLDAPAKSIDAHHEAVAALPDADVLLLSALPGRPWSDLLAELSPEDSRALRRQLGSVLAALHTVRPQPAAGDVRFGYPHRPVGLHADDWPAAFTAMVEAVLADGEHWGVPLPTDRVRRALRDHHGHLAEVTEASLVHFDLWPGNVFVATGPTGPTGPSGPSVPGAGGDEPRITGVIDTERAWWGDPLADLVGLDPFGTAEEDADLLDGYRAAGGRWDPTTPAARARLALYRVYLGLVMVVEVVPRGYSGDWLAEHMRHCENLLNSGLESL
ncbi:phosphotransferase family protein [Allostreptomyces psammosilenae]|uniref:Aminoglycoside phosphotransferase (APT) family kinase protein n=1 Tax=Allostreptomyces psammosilenae TaxID=1892865 RepID=A0A853A0A3_9ACTN|nr:phosphotransferase [Allostreptomyces psammosilenae]NYI07819.1 aminoglycoside phosphotransferase (APT) family kinase protein [Allostreptomyces psammosilenae]